MVVTKTKTSISEDQFAKTNKSSRCNTIGTNLRVIGDNLERRFQLRFLLQKPRQENHDRHLKTAIRFAVMKVLLAMIILWDWNPEECYLLRDWGSRDWSHGKRKFTFNGQWMISTFASLPQINVLTNKRLNYLCWNNVADINRLKQLNYELICSYTLTSI